MGPKKTGISRFGYKGPHLERKKQKTVVTYYLMTIVDEIIEKINISYFPFEILAIILDILLVRK